MPELSVEDWKEFIKARLLQEAGKDGEAFPVFDKLAKAYPRNPHAQTARAFALLRMDQKDDATSARLDAAYSKAAAALSGSSDRPEAWTRELNSLLEMLPGGIRAESAASAW